MVAAGFANGATASRSIGDDFGSRGNRRTGEISDGDFPEGRDTPQQDLIVLAVVSRGDGGDERRLTRGSPAASARTHATDVGVVDLDFSLQSLAFVAFQHDLPELVLHHPRRRLGDAETPGQFEAGHAFLGLRDVIDGFEPDAQSQLARRENQYLP